ncbi:nucleoside transporter [Neolewinella xylanilytica]|uniref:Nucleoside transporter n=1 Tax=Neolewinella xylanilytica TaxID=1514080 RepID=A0A2S6I1C8_9BACT|nr:MFS transporter [Neolewinella xylanilytica]PPK84770.1 nucleoside transporter [Neolewinella xylanilytica]
MSGQKGGNRHALGYLKGRLSVLLFLQFAVWSSWLINLGTYLLDTLEFTGLQVGMIYATNAIAATVAPPLMGWLADRSYPSERLMGVLNVIGGSALIACYFTTSFGWFYGWMLLFNLCFIPTFSLAAAMCFYHLERPAQEYPLIRVWGTVSFMLVGVALSVFQVEYSALPILSGGIVALLLAGYSFFLPHTPPEPGFNWAALRGEEVRSIFRERGMVVLLIALLASCIPSSFYYSFLNPFLNEVGWEAAAAKMALGQLFEIAVVLAMPIIFRRFRFRGIIFWGLMAWGLRYFAFGIGRPGDQEWLLYAGIMVQGVAFAWIIIAAQIYVNNRVPSYLRNTAQGLISFANLGLGAFLGSWIAGETVSANLLADGTHDWWSIWVVPGTVGIGAAVFFWVAFPRSGRL